MVRHRRKVPVAIKTQLYNEVGNKCANPGCANTLLELHHIKQWHVYQTHDAADMVAICPTCHSHVHTSALAIDDATVRRWKLIERPNGGAGHIYVEPALDCQIVLGSLKLVQKRPSADYVTIFHLSDSSHFGFRLVGTDVMLVNLVSKDAAGREFIRIEDGYVKHISSSDVKLESRPGRIELTAPYCHEYLPEWVSRQFYQRSPPQEIEKAGRYTVVGLHVLDRGLVQLTGVWFGDNSAIVVGDRVLSLSSDDMEGFVHIMGVNRETGSFERESFDKMPTITFEGVFDRSLLAAATNRDF